MDGWMDGEGFAACLLMIDEMKEMKVMTERTKHLHY